VARGNHHALLETGSKLILKSTILNDEGKEFTVVPFEGVFSALKPPSSEPLLTHPFSYIVICSKAIYPTTPTLVEQLEPYVTPGVTTFVFIQNGVGIEDDVAKRWQNNTILSAVTWIGAKGTNLAEAEHLHNLGTTFGLYRPEGSRKQPSQEELLRRDHFVELLKNGGGEPEIVEDIQSQRWKKVVWNCAWNSLTSLTRLDTSTMLSSTPYTTPLVHRLMREVIKVGETKGLIMHTVDATGKQRDLVDELMEKVSVRPLGSSMWNDLEAGKRIEVEVILGHPLREAKRLGVDTPVLETLYCLLAAADARSAGTIASLV
jgi:2-dehydropantoate 2-reductase